MEQLEPRVLLAADPVISEFLAVNRGGLNDAQGRSPDWVEIYNPADTAVDLAGWSLTDRPSEPRRWVFPSYRLEAGEYGIVFASGDGRTGPDDAVVRDIHTTLDGTFQVDMPSGTYAVELTLGDRNRVRDNVAIYLQGELVGMVTAAADEFATPRYRTEVSAATGGTLTVRLEDTGGATARAAIAALVVAPIDTNAPRQFDFGTPDSPVAAGFQQVTTANRYSPQSGFGWLADTVVSQRDRVPASLYPHTNFSLNSDGEYLALVSPAGEVVSEFGTPEMDFPPQHANVSFGLVAPDGAERFGYFATPTPGGPNAVGQAMTGPAFYSVTDRPSAIDDNQDLIVTAAVAPLNAAVASATLTYRVMYGSEVTVAMVDDGSGADAIAGDGILTATIPRDAAGPGDLVRWYVTAADVTGNSARTPQFFAPTASPEYFGTIVSDPAVASELPVLQWFLQPGTEGAANTRSGTRAALLYDGEFYDNVFVRVRGNTSANLVKKSYKFDFNPGNHFRFAADTPRVSEINVNTTYTNKDTIRQALAFDTYAAAGVAGSVAFPIRVQRNGSFFSVAIFVEQPDEDLLRREGLDPDGAFYKMYNTFTSGTSRVEKRTRRDEDNSDLVDFIAQINGASGESLKRVVFDQVDIPAMLNYLAATVIMQNNDQSAKNYFLYRDTEGTGEWRMLPWDVDLTFGLHFMTNDSILDDVIWADKDAFTTRAGATIWPSHPLVGDRQHPGNRSWNRLIDALYRVPEFRSMYLRRLRTLMDQLLQPPETATEALRFERQLDDWLSRLAPDVALDYAKWADPWAWGRDLSLADAIDQIKTQYLTVRRVHLYETHSIDHLGSDVAGIPQAQIGNPQIAIDSSDFEIVPLSGDLNEQYLKLSNPSNQAVDISGWRLSGPISFQFRPGTVLPAGGSLYVAADVATFRARTVGPRGGQGLLVQGGYTGRMDHPGETIQLVAADGSQVSSLTLPNKLLGDMNLDGVVSSADINAFVLALSDPAAYATTYGVPATGGGDVDADGDVDFDDIDDFVDLIHNMPGAVAAPSHVTTSRIAASPHVVSPPIVAALPLKQRPTLAPRHATSQTGPGGEVEPTRRAALKPGHRAERADSSAGSLREPNAMIAERSATLLSWFAPRT